MPLAPEVQSALASLPPGLAPVLPADAEALLSALYVTSAYDITSLTADKGKLGATLLTQLRNAKDQPREVAEQFPTFHMFWRLYAALPTYVGYYERGGGAVGPARQARAGLAQRGQQGKGAAVGFAHARRVWRGVEDARPLHGRGLVQLPPRKGFVTPAHAFQAAREHVAPALGKHRDELRREAHQLRRRVHAPAAADGQDVAVVAAAGHGDTRRGQGVM